MSKFARAAVVAVFIAVLCSIPFRVASGADESRAAVPDIVVRASKAYAAALHGYVGMQRHFSTTIAVGPIHHSEQSDSAILLKDGVYAAVKYYRVMRDRQPFTSEQVDARTKQTGDDWSAGKIYFKEPYDPRFMADYHFSEQPQCRCPAGTVEIDFTSNVNDTQHGAGQMFIERASGHVDKLTYVPNALPAHVSSGGVTETGRQALTDLWYVTRIDEWYAGRALVLKGTATFVGTFDHFRRFASLTGGLAALNDGSI